MQTDLIICAGCDYSIDHLAGVVHTGDRQLPERAGELNC